jgi:dimethylhistidine N-methyltransferase
MTKKDDFSRDVLAGLSGAQKSLPSKYFYDDEGSRLFRKIMELPEYYLTRAEFEIFQTTADDILDVFAGGANGFEIVELGAGDGTKTALLIERFIARGADFTYVPIDISIASVEWISREFETRFPTLRTDARQGDYFDVLARIPRNPDRRRVVLFLGSNIGNFSNDQAGAFFRRVGDALLPDDLLMTGFDLMKDPRVILAAYDDSAGVTSEFNLNLLRRINRELGADFDCDKFSHSAFYDPSSGAAMSYLVSREEQSVRIGENDIRFAAWESIFTEVSQKYSPGMIAAFARENGFSVTREFTDSNLFFVDSVWTRE